MSRHSERRLGEVKNLSVSRRAGFDSGYPPCLRGGRRGGVLTRATRVIRDVGRSLPPFTGEGPRMGVASCRRAGLSSTPDPLAPICCAQPGRNPPQFPHSERRLWRADLIATVRSSSPSNIPAAAATTIDPNMMRTPIISAPAASSSP